MKSVLAGNMPKMELLASRLTRLPWMSRSAIDQGTEPGDEAWRIVHGLADIEESVDRLYRELVPRLLVPPDDGMEANEAAVEDLLLEIRAEYQHILYHIRDATPFGLE